ncbi:MAG: EamA family transporter [Tumebacillaceae bacterium]
MHKYKGYGMAVIGASLWGISGTVAQTLFHDYGFTSGWLVPVRMFLSGLLLLLLTKVRTKERLTAVWSDRKSALQLLLFSAVGMLGVQYTYFACIQAGNAATATLLQFLGPMMIMVYLAIRMKRIPSKREISALLFAFLGVFLLVTNGSTSTLSIAPTALFWGLLSATTAAFYTLQPKPMLEKWGSGLVIGWGMLVGSVVLALFTQPWSTTGLVWTPNSIFSVIFVILLGTLVPFFLFLDSLRFITATEASLLASAEPLVAVIASVMWLHIPMHLFEGIGAFCIIATVLLLSMQKPQTQQKEAL